MLRLFGLLFIVFTLLYSPVHVFAQTASPSATPQTIDVSLSEFYACQGAGESEWVEIQNNTSSEVTLTNWKLRDTTSSNKYQFTLTLPANGYGTVEIPESNGFFNNTSKDSVKLVDSNDVEKDKYDYESCDTSDANAKWVWAKLNGEWKKTAKQTKGSANIYTAVVSTASPTSTSQSTPTPTSTPAPTATATPSPTNAGPQPTTVFLSEVSACQLEGEKEWVELGNSGSTSVTLTNWKLTDDDNNDQPIPSLTISAKGYSVVEIAKYSRGMLTNDGDVVSLFDGTGKKIDSYSYQSCTKGSTFAKNGSSWAESTSPTKGTVNAAPTITLAAAQISELGDGDDSVASASTQPGEILGTETSEEESPEPSATPEPSEPKEISWIAIGSIGVGTTILGGIGGYLGWEKWKKRKQK